MNRTRKLAIGVALMTVVGIPGAALAGGQSNCVGPSVQFLHTAFMGLAQSDPGAVGELVNDIRTNPGNYPWCG